VAHKHLTSAFLVVLIPIECSLNVNIGLLQEDQLDHERSTMIPGLSFGG
jgi:hypothetical protein